MRSVLYLTDRNDPLTEKILKAAAGRLGVEVSDDPAALQCSEKFDAALVGDIRLGQSVDSIEGPKFIQLTSGHHADLNILDLQRSGVTAAGSSPVLSRYVAMHALGLVCAVIGNSRRSGLNGREDIEISRSQYSVSLKKLRLGIVGFGRVGQRMAEVAKGLFKEVVFSDVRTPPHGVASALGIRRSTLDLVLSTCDVVSLHVQWGPASDPLIDEREIRLMSRESVLINTADVRLVNESALIAALENDEIRGAGLDASLGSEHPILTTPGSVVTPHVAGRSSEADDEVANFVIGNIEKALGDGEPQGLIELIDFPRSGDPSFWSSEMAPRT